LVEDRDLGPARDQDGELRPAGLLPAALRGVLWPRGQRAPAALESTSAVRPPLGGDAPGWLLLSSPRPLRRAAGRRGARPLRPRAPAPSRGLERRVCPGSRDQPPGRRTGGAPVRALRRRSQVTLLA